MTTRTARRFLLFLLLALVGGTTLVAVPASAYGTGGFTVGNVSQKSYGCFYHPYQINLNIGPETTEWDVEARVLAPNGSVHDSGYESGTGGGPRTIAEEIFFCSSSDNTGTYTVTGTLSTYEGSSDYTPTTVSLATAAFQLIPLPTWDVVGERPDVDHYRYSKKFGISLSTKTLPAGRPEGKAYTWNVFVNGTRVKSITQTAGESKYWATKALKPRTTYKLVIRGNGTVRHKSTMTTA